MSTSINYLQPDQVAECISIWQDRMAKGYDDQPLLEKAASKNELATCLVATNAEGQVVGFTVGKVIKFSEAISVPYAELEPIDIEPNELVSYLSPTCVDREYERQGIGTTLRRALIGEFVKFDQTAITEIWHRKGVDGRNVNVPLGFVNVKSDDRYWEFSSTKCGECPECRQTPCACSGGLYVLSVDQQRLVQKSS